VDFQVPIFLGKGGGGGKGRKKREEMGWKKLKEGGKEGGMEGRKT
jgi:hypothetical protein